MRWRCARILVLVAAPAAVGCGDDGGTGGEETAGTVEIQISGEELGPDGFRFPDGSEVTIADGWEIVFDHVFVTVGRAWLSDSPDKSPGDQSQTGPDIAEAVGPWAVDLAREGSVPGAGGEGTAIPLATIDRQNLADGQSFAADQRYAFSFSFDAATSDAALVNFADDPDAVAAYDEAVEGGYAVYYVGTATFKGVDCAVSDDAYDFDAIPRTISFKLGFATPTHYLNCQNEDNDGDPFAGEEYQRGIAIRESGASLAQITVHLEHPFYADVQHEPALYFDQIAARAIGLSGTELSMDHLKDVDPTGFTDGADGALPWRTCDGSPVPGVAMRAFEVGGIPVGPGQDPSHGFRDYRDFMAYVQSAQGHMNGGEGLCFIDRQYESPR